MIRQIPSQPLENLQAIGWLWRGPLQAESLELPPLSFVVFDGKRSADGFVVRDCWFHDNFQRTLINGAPNMWSAKLLENSICCAILGVSEAAIKPIPAAPKGRMKVWIESQAEST